MDPRLILVAARRRPDGGFTVDGFTRADVSMRVGSIAFLLNDFA